MKKQLYKLFFVTFFLLNIGLCNADTLIKKEVKQSETISKSDNNSISDSNIYYKLLYENAKENNDQMITMLQWVLGLSTAFLLTLFGAQIFFNWKLNKKEIEYIKKDIDEKIGELKASLLKDLNNDFKTNEIGTNSKIDKSLKEITGNLEKQIAEKSKFLEFSEKLWQKEAKNIKDNFNNRYKILESDTAKNSGDIWKLQGVESNALTLYLKTALLKKETKNDLNYIFDDIISILNTRNEIHQIDYNSLKELIKDLDKIYDEKKNLIVSLLKNKPIYVWSDKPEIGIGKIGSFYGQEKKYVKNEPK